MCGLQRPAPFGHYLTAEMASQLPPIGFSPGLSALRASLIASLNLATAPQVQAFAICATPRHRTSTALRPSRAAGMSGAGKFMLFLPLRHQVYNKRGRTTSASVEPGEWVKRRAFQRLRILPVTDTFCVSGLCSPVLSNCNLRK